MQPEEIRRLADVQFILSEPVGRLLREMPALARRLATTTVHEEEWSAERVRGAVNWGSTLSARVALGLPHLYVTAPAKRAFQTPENEVLVHSLGAIEASGRRTGWHRSSSADVGVEVRDRTASAARWSRTRALADVEQRPITSRLLTRVRSGRNNRRYGAAVEVSLLHQQMLRQLDSNLIRKLVQQHALVASRDHVLLELLCSFEIERVLRAEGWRLSYPGLLGTGRFLRASRQAAVIDVYYQHAPAQLSRGSRYREVQRVHGFENIGGLIPDLALRISNGDNVQWLLVEVKGIQRGVVKSARAAANDLLAYRRAFETALRGNTVYGLGIAWGSDLRPKVESEICLCTPDTVGIALRMLLEALLDGRAP